MYVVEILVPLKEQWEDFFDFFDFRNARISPKDACAMSPQMNEDNSLSFRTKSNNPLLSGRLLIACSIKAPVGNSVVGNRLSCAWSVNKKQVLKFSNDSHLAVHFPGTPDWHCSALLHKTILNDAGDILYGRAKHAVHDSKGSCYYFVSNSNYSLDQDCINAHN